MEFKEFGGRLMNMGGEVVDIEPDYVFPMLKTSQVASGTIVPKRWMLVPQRSVGEPTETIAERAPRTFAYLKSHRDALDRRKSSIYKGQPPFSIFGVGAYAFAPWKVAISGLYKHLSFRVLGPHGGKPVMLDDTSYFLPCNLREEAELLAEILNSDESQGFFRSFIFWDAKRPVTAELLRKLDLLKVAQELHLTSRLNPFLDNGDAMLHDTSVSCGAQMQLF
jgi:hypothetical protein